MRVKRMERDGPNGICDRSIHRDNSEGCFRTVMCVICQGGGPAERGFFGPYFGCWLCTELVEAKYIDIAILCQRISQLRVTW